MEHPKKLRTFADEYSTVGVSAAFFSMSVSSQKLSTAPWHEMKNAFLYHRASVRRAFNTKYIMYMVNKCVEAGSRESHEPRLIGEVIKDLLMNSNEPLAVAYRKRHQTDTHLDVDSSQQLAFEKRRVQ